MDVISLTGLKVRGHHGVFDFERRHGQDFLIDVVLELDLTRPTRTDDIGDTVDYGALAEALVAIAGGEPVNLIETLAGRLAERCLRDERVDAVTVTVHKPQAPVGHEFADVSVTLRRSRA
jgi:dihydroneopterin aldolase